MAAMEVRAQAEKCLHQLELLARIRDEVGQDDEADHVVIRELNVDDQLARFRIWAGNIGAFAVEHASLDHRLRDNEADKQLMIRFLNTLWDLLQRAIDALKPDLMHVLDTTDSDSAPDPSVSSITSSSFHGTETGSAIFVQAASVSPFEYRLEGIEKAIDRLYRLSLMIRRPSIAGQNSKAEKIHITNEHGDNIDLEFTSFAREIVNRQFPEAAPNLRERLASGIVIRRKRFLYRQRHQRKLSTKTVLVEHLEQQGTAKTGSDGGLASTVRGLRIAAIDPAIADQSSNTALQNGKAPSQTTASAMTQSPIAINLVMDDEESRQSTTFTNTPTRGSPMYIPDPPRPPKGSKEFECPYCCMMLPISRAKASSWRKHVLADLEPYVCVFDECSEDHAFFRDRESWIAHMRKSHATRWLCNSPAHEPRAFNTEHAFDEHMWAAHEGTFTNPQLSLLRRRSRIPTTVLFIQCPLCGWTASEEERRKLSDESGTSPISQAGIDKRISDIIAKHLSTHLEAVSVKALPWTDAEDDSIEVVKSQAADEGTAQSEDDSQSFRGMLSDSLPSPDPEEGAEPLTSWLVSDDHETMSFSGGSYEQDWGFLPLSPYYGPDRDPVLQTLLRKLYLETSPFAKDATGPKLPAYLVPIERDKSFFARSHALQMIEETLFPDPQLEQTNAKPPTFPRCFAVYGPGGMGKTQIAAEFVASHRKAFDAILWAHAENSSRLLRDFKEMAVRLGLVSENSADANDLAFTRDILKRWLVNPVRDIDGTSKSGIRKASWLLVFDGVENGDDLNEFWPYDGPGSILITSRNPHSWTKSLELVPFSMNEATDYLMHITGKHASHQEKSSAMAVAKRLGGLPLALAQMGSIIVHKSLSFQEFLRSFDEKEGQEMLLQWPSHDGKQRGSQYEHSVASVWAFDSLGKGLLLLNILSMLDPEGIPENLFDSTKSSNDAPELADLKKNFKEARDELLARSLVTRSKREKKLIIHRLVQDVSRSRLFSSELRHVFLLSVKLVASNWIFEKFEWRHGNERWAECEEMLPHVQRLKDLFPDMGPATDISEDFEFARLLVDAGWYRHERGRSADANLFNNMAQSICESLKLRFLEDTDYAAGTSLTLSQVSYTLTEITHNRGCIALEVNDPVSALRYHQQFNNMMIKDLGIEGTHQDMRLGISWNELGNSFMLNEDWVAGEECFLKAIAEMRRLNDFKPTHVSLPLANLSLSYWLQGKLDLASQTLLHGLKERETEFGIDDRQSFIKGRFLHGLGNVCEAQNHVDESLSYHRRALQHYKATLGNRHHRTADVFVKVADHQIRMQQYETALALLDHALEAYLSSNVFKPELMRALFKRAKALRALEKTEEADAELSKCYSLYYPIMREKVRVMGLRAGQFKKRPVDLVDLDVDTCVSFRSR